MRTEKHLDQVYAHPPPVAVERKTDSWSADKKSAIAGLIGILALGILGWGVWTTQELSGCQRTLAVQAELISSNDRSSRERDKQVTELAAQAQASIQAQLAQIQAQLAEIQKELRHRP
jgi:uncharacterized protein HemX